jgi:hypothetical protein
VIRYIPIQSVGLDGLMPDQVAVSCPPGCWQLGTAVSVAPVCAGTDSVDVAA